MFVHLSQCMRSGTFASHWGSSQLFLWMLRLLDLQTGCIQPIYLGCYFMCETWCKNLFCWCLAFVLCKIFRRLEASMFLNVRGVIKGLMTDLSKYLDNDSVWHWILDSTAMLSRAKGSKVLLFSSWHSLTFCLSGTVNMHMLHTESSSSPCFVPSPRSFSSPWWGVHYLLCTLGLYASQGYFSSGRLCINKHLVTLLSSQLCEFGFLFHVTVDL